jgi:hypothetical protein
MKQILFLFSIALMAQGDILAQQKPVQFMQVTTVESVVGGGLGRSKMIITKEDGSQEERDLENLFSIAGINFKNIRENENNIIRTLKSFTDNGWKLLSTVPLTLSPNQGGSGIFMTRYLFQKESQDK